MPARLLALLLPLLLAAVPALAQPGRAVLSGTVLDAATGAPLAGAHVFIARTTLGTTTDDEGRYRLPHVPLGAQRLYVSIVGYEPAALDLNLRTAEVHVHHFRLAPAVIELEGEVVVEGERDERWERHLRRFERLFLGESPNAVATRILNPEVLEFTSVAGRFTAHAPEPLVIENRALGYRIQYFLKDFVALPTRIRYDGEPLFEELEPSGPEEAARWKAARQSAFLGSLRHLLLALKADRTEGQGFLLYHRPSRGPGTAGANRMAANRFPIERGDILRDGEHAGEHVLEFTGALEVIFQGEHEDPSYRDWDWNPNRGTDTDRLQTSWLRLEQGPTVIDYKGDPVDPYGITTSGYLAFERVSDEVPKDYRPF